MIQTRIRLWENSGVAYDDSDRFHPVLETYILDGTQPRGVVLICPGGGYRWTSPRESEPVALQFTAAGWHAIVLHYSVAPRRYPQPLRDVSRAVCLIRERAETWHVDPQKIVVCGFSAGGHLAALLGVHWDKPVAQATPNMPAGQNRPNALILGYPVITTGEKGHVGSRQQVLGENPDPALLAELSVERHVNTHTPPTFLWHTFEDQSVPLENSLLFAQALRQHQIPFELHVYPYGRHGLSLATAETATPDLAPNPHVAGWIRMCIEWLQIMFQAPKTGDTV